MPINDRRVRGWLIFMAFSVCVLVLFGGYTRLTRSGLSIVEWDVITGVIPPLTETQWLETFAKYQETPEFQKINMEMNLEQYKQIFLVEYFHRLLGRIAGLAYVLPLFYFLFTGVIPWRKSWPYLSIGLMFAFQGFMGWYMVSSGLVDRPAVSHFRLTAHLLTALLILGLCVWQFFQQTNIFKVRTTLASNSPYWLGWLMMGILILQISYGGFMAGLRAGYISNTFPLMGGKLIPSGMFSTYSPWYLNALEAPFTVHFIHRWLAFVVLLAAIWVFQVAKNKNLPDRVIKQSKNVIWIVSFQIFLGVSVIWFSMPISLALIHQGFALVLFVAVLLLNHTLQQIKA